MSPSQSLPSYQGVGAARRRISTETKASFKTTELVAFVVVALGILIASAVVDASDFGAQEAWFYVTLLTIGYMVSRGLAKSGSRDFYDDEDGRDSRSGGSVGSAGSAGSAGHAQHQGTGFPS
ncbi:hypothetical protein QE364_003892 [Nocardioides zeae]|uniref:Uncharacterized protein n=2 Tax=Nocardioides zeae TaxID=1457234 RepID=A0AAJ1U2B6_9ACTN|nr:hypothetical protein [Nocardioides zeae]MDQ1102977.1 hypothetical protein [Nocardioides zeae]MDR6173290.1 hypothetical protein [Nocardioides zeae]MDR6212161.1 hypothetical protein [Nocardioides zeae]